MKTAVIDETAEGVVNYNASLVALLNHFREDFFLARSVRDLDHLNAQFEAWRATVANARVHATTRGVVAEHVAEERPALIAHPAMPYSAVLTVERRVSHEGMISVGGNLYSVPDATRRRTVGVQNHRKELRIFEDGALIAVHPVLEGRNQRRLDPSHRRAPPPASSHTPGPEAAPGGVGVRPLSFYDAVARRLAGGSAAS
jgi:hypothetical protein